MEKKSSENTGKVKITLLQRRENAWDHGDKSREHFQSCKRESILRIY
jgi:hypothetical protein